MARPQPFADLARSLGLLLLIVAVVLLIGPARALIFPGADKRPPVDDSDVVHGFAEATGHAALLPTPPTDWQVNGASLEHTRVLGEHLHVGWLTADGHYLGVDEATGSAQALERSILGKPGLRVTDTTDAPGHQWEVRRSARGETAYTATYGDVTVVVTGDATPEEFDLALRSFP